jgi:hypothetical protein
VTVAVVVSYWPERHGNVRRIVADLMAGSLPPSRIIVLNNNPAHSLRYLESDGVDVIEGTANWECRGKFIVGLLDPAPYYLMMDDDTTVGETTLECFMRHARRGCVFGFWGVQIIDGSFHRGRIIFPNMIRREVPVDAFHGRGMFMAYDALVRMLALEEHVRVGKGWATVGDDLIAGLANPGASVVPMHGTDAFVSLSEEGVAMCAEDGYFEMRDRFLMDVLDTIADHGLPAAY